MTFEWALHLVYAVDVLLLTVMMICVGKIQWAGFHYVTSSVDPKYCEVPKPIILNAGLSLLGVMGLFSLNRFIAMLLLGSTEAYREWQVAHATELREISLPIFVTVLGVYGLTLLVRMVRKKNDAFIASLAEAEKIPAAEQATHVDVALELEKILLVIEKRY